MNFNVDLMLLMMLCMMMMTTTTLMMTNDDDEDDYWQTTHVHLYLYFIFPGTHYYRNLSKDLQCEKIYPLFLLYDTEGNLGAFGWVFQGRPNNFQSQDGFSLTPDTYPVSFNLIVHELNHTVYHMN